MKPLLTVRDAANILSVCEDTVYGLVKRKLIKAVRIGVGKRQGIRFRYEVLEKWIERN
jgi:excisionase family DNA binding protein